jgi:hypothetical protein
MNLKEFQCWCVSGIIFGLVAVSAVSAQASRHARAIDIQKATRPDDELALADLNMEAVRATRIEFVIRN